MGNKSGDLGDYTPQKMIFTRNINMMSYDLLHSLDMIMFIFYELKYDLVTFSCSRVISKSFDVGDDYGVIVIWTKVRQPLLGISKVNAI